MNGISIARNARCVRTRTRSCPERYCVTAWSSMTIATTPTPRSLRLWLRRCSSEAGFTFAWEVSASLLAEPERPRAGSAFTQKSYTFGAWLPSRVVGKGRPFVGIGSRLGRPTFEKDGKRRSSGGSPSVELTSHRKAARLVRSGRDLVGRMRGPVVKALTGRDDWDKPGIKGYRAS